MTTERFRVARVEAPGHRVTDDPPPENKALFAAGYIDSDAARDAAARRAAAAKGTTMMNGLVQRFESSTARPGAEHPAVAKLRAAARIRGGTDVAHAALGRLAMRRDAADAPAGLGAARALLEQAIAAMAALAPDAGGGARVAELDAAEQALHAALKAVAVAEAAASINAHTRAAEGDDDATPDPASEPAVLDAREEMRRRSADAHRHPTSISAAPRDAGRADARDADEPSDEEWRANPAAALRRRTEALSRRPRGTGR